MQFVKTMEANILAEIKAVVSVVITQIVPGPVKVSSSIVFTGADSTAALAGASAVAAVLASGDVSTIVGTSFGTVAVSGVTQGNATNPGKSRHSQGTICPCGLISCTHQTCFTCCFVSCLTASLAP